MDQSQLQSKAKHDTDGGEDNNADTALPTASVEKGQWNVLCVDDEKSVLKSIKRVLKTGNYNVFLANSGQEGLFLLEYQPIDIIISDMMMPNMNGAEFLAESLQYSPDAVRILLTGHADLDSTIAAINEGKIQRFLHKPWDNTELLMVLEDATHKLQLERENAALLATINRQNKRLSQLNKQLGERVDLRTKQVKTALHRVDQANSRAQINHRNTLRAIFNLISQNPNLQGHLAIEISEICYQMARALGLDHKEIRAIRLAGQLNELGLLCLPDEIASTPLIRMNKEQKEMFYSHPVKAALALAPSIALNNVSDVIKHQYEHMDGSGTPDRLWGDQIPVGSRILALARDFVLTKAGKLNSTDAVTEALQDIEKQSGTWYDKSLVEMLPEIVTHYEQAQKPNEHELILTTDKLQTGMELSRALFSSQELLLLSESHILTTETIERIKGFEKTNREALTVYVFSADDTD